MKKMPAKESICLPSLKLLGDYWTLRIVDELASDELRFCELERRLESSNTATISRRLKDMLSGGLLERREVSRADVTYSLTPLGRKVVPVINAINDFSAAKNKRG